MEQNNDIRLLLRVTELKTSKMAARGRVEPPEKHFINWTVGVRWLVSTDRDHTKFLWVISNLCIGTNLPPLDRKSQIVCFICPKSEDIHI